MILLTAMNNSSSKNLIFLDTETTGLDNGRLVQLAYKLQDEDMMLVEFYKPPVPIDIEAMAVHHITEKKVADKPQFEKSATFKALSTLLPRSILVAHNAKFDMGVLEREGIIAQDFICTMKVAKALYDYPNY